MHSTLKCFHIRFGDKIVAAKNDSSKRQTLLLDRGVSQGLVTSGKIVRKAYHQAASGGPHKPPTNSIHPSSFNNSRYAADRANVESDPFRLFGINSGGNVSPARGGLSVNHPMLDRSSKMPYKALPNTEIMKRALR